jgi:hypothetical protein
MTHRQLFWLHIKKSGGMTARSLLRPHYVEVDREKKPKTFIQASPEEYNDILNNYRVVLGDYQFRRCLFAKTYLYPRIWDDLFSFAFSREPIDRCVSMFYYLFWKDRRYLINATRSITKLANSRKLMYNTSYAFSVFLNYVYEARESDSIYTPLGIHFTTHTAPMWDDVTDFSGCVLLREVYRLENMVEGINRAFEMCGIQNRVDKGAGILNGNKARRMYTPNRTQIAKIQEIYLHDFDIYENAWH